MAESRKSLLRQMQSSLKRWEREFRSAAENDRLALFRDHLGKLDLPDEPENLLQGTILMVQACCIYGALDGQPCDNFLAFQKYRPSDAADAKYAVTFDLCGKSIARLLIPTTFTVIDLADLMNHPWYEYEVSGYSCFWVSRTDGNPLSDEEVARIEEEVTYDLEFDYAEDDLTFWFDDSAVEGVLLVTLQEHSP